MEIIKVIQKLWGGYGELCRVNLENGPAILKNIRFPEELNSDRSHNRKVKSYRVEKNWYENYNEQIQHARYPKFISCGEVNANEKYLLMEDLGQFDFIDKKSISWKEVQLCLKWLAKFHAHFLDKKPEGLWEVGTYWHLETRPDELEALDDHELKMAAGKIDNKLNQAKYKTIVHGDAKLANFLFNDEEVSAVDFQYVGGGVGVKDVAYFLSSIYNEDELLKKESECLDFYFSELGLGAEVEKEWREMYPYAWCDFYRFLKGWSPGHYKLNTYSKNMKEKVLSWI